MLVFEEEAMVEEESDRGVSPADFTALFKVGFTTKSLWYIIGKCQ